MDLLLTETGAKSVVSFGPKPINTKYRLDERINRYVHVSYPSTDGSWALLKLVGRHPGEAAKALWMISLFLLGLPIAAYITRIYPTPSMRKGWVEVICLEFIRLCDTYCSFSGNLKLSVRSLGCLAKSVFITLVTARSLRQGRGGYLFLSHHNYLGFVYKKELGSSKVYTQAAGVLAECDKYLVIEPDAIFSLKGSEKDSGLMKVGFLSESRDLGVLKDLLKKSTHDDRDGKGYLVLVMNRMNDSPFYRMCRRIYPEYFSYTKATIELCARMGLSLKVVAHPHVSKIDKAQKEIEALCRRLRRAGSDIVYESKSWKDLLSKELTTILTFDGSVVLEAVAIGVRPVVIGHGAIKNVKEAVRPSSRDEYRDLLRKAKMYEQGFYRCEANSVYLREYFDLTTSSRVGALVPMFGDEDARQRTVEENSKRLGSGTMEVRQINKIHNFSNI